MKKKLKFKLLVTFSILLLVTCVVMSVLLFRSSMTLVKDSIGKQVSSTVENAAKVIDLHEYTQIDTETDYYYTLREQLNQIRELNNMEYLFTMSREKMDSGYDYYYVVDGMPLDSEDASGLGEKEENADIYPGMERAFESGKVEFEMTNDEDYGALISVFAPIKNETGEIIGVIGADMDATLVYEDMDANQLKTGIITVVILIVGLGFVYFFTDYLTKPLQKLTKQVEQVGKGDLSVLVETNRKDEIGVLTKTFGKMVVDLRQVIQGIHYNSERFMDTSTQLLINGKKINEASKNISISIEEVSEGADQQYQYSEESTVTLDQISQGIQQVTSSSANVSDLSNETLNNAHQGNQSIENVIKQMSVINKSVQLSSNVIKELEDQSREISLIINMIRDISAQTNLLALNAAIEAARAGEAGKGFAVVAEEVRKLAEQTEQSTNSISELIRIMNEDTVRTVESMSVVAKNVNDGIRIVEVAGSSFESIVDSIEHVSRQIKEISMTLEEMSASSEELAGVVEETTSFSGQVANNTKDVVKLTTEQKAYVDEISESILHLTEMSKDLDDLVKKFVL